MTADLQLPSDFTARLWQGYCQAGVHSPGQLLLAVSGGADSMALLHGTRKIAESASGWRLVVAHVNHCLRGQRSDQDAEFVRTQAESLGLACEVLTAGPPEGWTRSGQTLEEAARKLRYEFLQQVACQYRLNHVVTAHHADDQAETVLHQILRGSGLRGLRGMSASRTLTDQLQVVRPLLTVSRSQILEFLEQQQLPWRTDESNSNPDFTRNRLRHQLLPLLHSDYNAQASQNLVSLAEQCDQLLECLDELGQQVLAAAMLDRQPMVCRLQRQILISHPKPLVRHALTLLWQRQQWPRQKMTRQHWQSLADGIFSGADYHRDLPAGVRAEIHGELIRLSRTQRALRDAGL